MSENSMRALTSKQKKGMLDLAILFYVCAFIVFGIILLTFLHVDLLTSNLQKSLDVYVHKDDESSSLVSLLGAERNDYLYMELLGYKSMTNYNPYIASELVGIRSTVRKTGKDYNLDIFYNTQVRPPDVILSGQPNSASTTRPDSGGKCRTEQNPGLLLSWPLGGGVPYKISSGFGWREAPKDASKCVCHGGIDIAAVTGTDVIAAADGLVVFAREGTQGSGYNFYGYTVSIYHEGYGFSTMYGHMLAGSISVKVGDRVKKGSVIGKLGNTGESTGPHLHFEVDKGRGRKDSFSAVNICPFLDDVPSECIHWNVDVCAKDGLVNNAGSSPTDAFASTVGKAKSNDVSVLPEDYITEIPLPGAQSGYIKGVVGGMI